MLENSSLKKSVVAAKFGFPLSTLSTIMKNNIIQVNIENDYKTMKKSHVYSFPDVGKCVRNWFKQYYGEGVPISVLMLQKKD